MDNTAGRLIIGALLFFILGGLLMPNAAHSELSNSTLFALASFSMLFFVSSIVFGLYACRHLCGVRLFRRR